ncbi:MAG: hypothetical protein BECKG1743D_GA0114223_102903 [Candidatus Kentron sp. G]|nr:MAG: hypothetical protein BECKG1743F_GA0114225_102434 [Candidatus Kentron sp. G]VFM99426.1 MAG: hypothetical protein BECKG1743E_GA0114224_102564 [Candidatus Kentron sp. G]VFN01550.1 MAG: hypothetical protein BECKG1743D_GA0114223_102903 [Candidatus Kentron sp. G]
MNNMLYAQGKDASLRGSEGLLGVIRRTDGHIAVAFLLGYSGEPPGHGLFPDSAVIERGFRGRTIHQQGNRMIISQIGNNIKTINLSIL